MKNRKILFGLIILVLVAAIGIGYASLTKTLTINGKMNAAAATANDFLVAFSDATKGANCTEATYNGLSATMTTGQLKMGQQATATFVITNSSVNFKAKVDNQGDTTVYNVGEYFRVTVTDLGSGEILAADGGNTTVTVTVELVKAPLEAISNQTFTVNFTADPQEIS